LAPLEKQKNIYNCLGKRVRKRRRKKKPAESAEQLNNGRRPKTLPVTIIEQNQEPPLSPVTDHPQIEIVPANPDARVDESAWIERNEALLIAELETRRQAGLPVEVVVRVEKITLSSPEYCQIIPDVRHLDVIKEETSASDEDRRQQSGPRQSNGDDRQTNGRPSRGDGNRESENGREAHTGDPTVLERRLETLESPSLVRESSESVRFADAAVTIDNVGVVFESEIVASSERLLTTTTTDANHVGNNGRDTDNRLLDDDANVTEEKIKNRPLNDDDDDDKTTDCLPNELLTSALADNELREDRAYDDACYYRPIEVARRQDKRANGSAGLRQFIDDGGAGFTSLAERERNANEFVWKNDNRTRTARVSQQDDTDKDDECSSDDSTIKPCETYGRETHKPPGAGRAVSLNDKLKRIARLLQDDTDDYEEIRSASPATSWRVSSLASDADVDTDWVSFTLSDGESSKSLCLSPSQLRSSHAPSTVSETSEIIDLHKKFLNRARSPNLSPRRDDAASEVDILGYYSASPSPSRSSYTSEVFDEACRMCGTSDEPLSDAECLVSLRKYRATRSRLLDVIQNEQRLDRSVIDRPSAPMPTFIDTLSVPDHRTRELMYTEYMAKVREREDRLHNKVIRITKAGGGRPLSSGSLLPALNDVDAEFLTKARERLEKLGVGADVEIEVKEQYYPKHLVDIVPENEVCIEEVLMNGESSVLDVACTMFPFRFVFSFSLLLLPSFY